MERLKILDVVLHEKTHRAFTHLKEDASPTMMAWIIFNKFKRAEEAKEHPVSDFGT